MFAIAGDINNTGSGGSAHGDHFADKLFFDIGGGIAWGQAFKLLKQEVPPEAILTEEGHLDIPMDYESLIQVGSMMGSGGLIVMDENTCMVDINARFFPGLHQRTNPAANVHRAESEPPEVLEILTRLTEGKGEGRYLKSWKPWPGTIKASSLWRTGAVCSQLVR